MTAIAPTLTQRALRGSAWTLAAYGGAQALRLGSQLVLQRLLFEQAFGLMALVNIVIQGLHMFSDLGIGQGIIASKRGNDPLLLQTAWTIQVIRGVVLFLLSCALAWPVAAFYANDELLWMLPAAGTTAAIAGLQSTSVFTRGRALNLGRLTTIDLCTQLVTLIVTALVAWHWPSAWALVIGNITAELLRTAFSHVALPGIAHRLRFDRECAKELTRVGRWIFVSTMLTFGSMQADRLILGKLLGEAILGLYHMPAMLVNAAGEVCKQLTSRVFFPVLSEIARTNPYSLPAKLRRIRLAVLWPTTIGLVGLSVFGQPLVEILFAPPWHGRGWVLRVLAAGLVAGVINFTAEIVWISIGDSFRMMVTNALRVAIGISAMLGGYAWRGEEGFVLGVASAELLLYPFQVVMLRKKGFWQPSVDLPLFAFAGVAIALGAWRG